MELRQHVLRISENRPAWHGRMALGWILTNGSEASDVNRTRNKFSLFSTSPSLEEEGTGVIWLVGKSRKPLQRFASYEHRHIQNSCSLFTQVCLLFSTRLAWPMADEDTKGWLVEKCEPQSSQWVFQNDYDDYGKLSGIPHQHMNTVQTLMNTVYSIHKVNIRSETFLGVDALHMQGRSSCQMRMVCACVYVLLLLWN